MDDPALLLCPGSDGGAQPWLYNNTLTDTSPPDAVLLASPSPSRTSGGKERRILVLNDLSVAVESEAEFQARSIPDLK